MRSRKKGLDHHGPQDHHTVPRADQLVRVHCERRKGAHALAVAFHEDGQIVWDFKITGHGSTGLLSRGTQLFTGDVRKRSPKVQCLCMDAPVALDGETLNQVVETVIRTRSRVAMVSVADVLLR